MATAMVLKLQRRRLRRAPKNRQTQRSVLIVLSQRSNFGQQTVYGHINFAYKVISLCSFLLPCVIHDPLFFHGDQKIKKKQKKATAEAATNGHSTPNTPVQTPSQSSEDSASDSEKETVRSAQRMFFAFQHIFWLQLEVFKTKLICFLVQEETPEQKEGAFSNFRISKVTIDKLKGKCQSFLPYFYLFLIIFIFIQCIRIRRSLAHVQCLTCLVRHSFG